MTKGERQKHVPSRSSNAIYMIPPKGDLRSRGEHASVDTFMLSLEEESSFHLSDYSVSSREEISPASTKAKRKHKEVQISARSTTLHPNLGGNSTAISSTGSSSSSESPWFDVSDASTESSSYATSRLRTVWKKEETVQSAAAPQLRVALPVPPRVPMRRSNSASSVGTGMHPSKPIDLTEAKDVSSSSCLAPSIPGQSRREQLKSTEKFDISQARIVGLAPQTAKACQPSMVLKKGQPLSMARPVPPVVIPEFCTVDDDVSSLEANVTDSRALPPYSRLHGKRSHLIDDAERGMNIRTVDSDTDSENSRGWIEERTNMELCLIFLVAVTLIALSILLTIMLRG